MANSNRWLVAGLLTICLLAVPGFLIALGFGWAWRGVAAVPHKLNFGLRSLIAP
jgi:hypothetical protein